MKLTVGMAAYDDFHGVAFTVQALRMGHPVDEIIIVDNHPSSPHGLATKKFAASCGSSVRYVPFEESTGTTQTREQIFREAKSDAVLCCDCHVLFRPNAIARLKQWYANNPETGDLHHGPMAINSLGNWHTHFNNYWRSRMWGTWGMAWHCPACKLQFTTMKVNDLVTFWDLATCSHEIAACKCNSFPRLNWAGHEQHLVRAGHQPLGFNVDDQPFEIPAQGLGVFTCRKDAWLGFNPHFRKFGGEEFYIHEKFRQHGRKVVLLPFLQWWHRFERPDGVKYPNTNWGKLRNYVLGLTELGLSLDPVYQHFISRDTGGLSLKQHLIEVHSGGEELDKMTDAEMEALHATMKFTDAEWQALLADPIRMTERPGAAPRGKKSGRPQPPDASSLDSIFAWGQTQKRDLDQHLALLKTMAQSVEHVTAFEKRRESSIAFAFAPAFVSYQKERDELLDALQALKPYELHVDADSLEVEPIAETDLLFFDTVMTGARVKAELDKHGDRVRRFIVIRGTGSFGNQAEGSAEPGLFAGIRPWLEEHPEWFVSHHAQNQYGLTVLSKNEADRPAKPIQLWPPGRGPGTEFKKMAKELEITMPNNCTCNALMVQMDVWGVAGCRDNREKIIEQIKANADKWGWTQKLANYAKAGFNAVWSGLVFKLNPLDPIPGMVDVAIDRAEVIEQQHPQEKAA